jgi:hypothetical protein
MSSGQFAIWTLNCSMILLAGILFGTGARTAQPVVGSMRVPFWALLVAFAAA